MNIKCPHCGTEYEVDKEWYGQYTTCDSCGKGFVVGTSRQNIEMITPLPDRMSTDVERKQGWSVPDTKTCLRQSKLPSQHGRYSTACFKWGWPCLVLIIFTLTRHNISHREKEDRPASPSAICPFCWFVNPRMQKGNTSSGLPKDNESRFVNPRMQKGNTSSGLPKDNESRAAVIVQKRIREIAAAQRQEEITEEKKRRNREMGRPEIAGFTADDYAAYSGGGRGGWAWRDKKEKGSRSFAYDLDYAFETSTGFSSDTRTDQEKKEDAILRQVLAEIRNRYRQGLHRIGSTESDYSLSERSCSLVLHSTENGLMHISYDIKSSALSDCPNVIPQTLALQLVRDRLSIDIIEHVIDP